MNQLNSAANVLPQKGVLFLGGHQNMTKKLRQQFPKWTYITDDQFNRKASLNQTVVFYWTGHSSHNPLWQSRRSSRLFYCDTGCLVYPPYSQ